MAYQDPNAIQALNQALETTGNLEEIVVLLTAQAITNAEIQALLYHMLIELRAQNDILIDGLTLERHNRDLDVRRQDETRQLEYEYGLTLDQPAPLKAPE